MANFIGECQPPKKAEAVADNVNHPAHYETGKFECIEVMEEALGKEASVSVMLLSTFTDVAKRMV